MKAYGNTDKGLIRKENEDAYYVAENENGDWIAVVCDGIGGSAAGEVASHIAVRTIQDAFEKAPLLHKDYEVNDWLQSVLNKANDAIYYKSAHSKKERGMGTTCVGLLVTQYASYIFNVGDSRIYADYKEGLIQMSEDHNVVSKLLRSGEITPEEAKTHAQRNTLTNALGVWHVFQIDFHKIDSKYNYVLICSDGLHGYVTHEDIQAVVENKEWTLQEKVDFLIAQANQAGGYDNITIILLENEGE
ncbi:MAG: Stp1/IreP family PP2C-type Ser/Thr phosphatase [Erysipelotrichaceae bacterium]|nr:Stp1/IreP family PP2C-type Ser/Thr phosphatase [Erysipelotrichaceae bacterium]